MPSEMWVIPESRVYHTHKDCRMLHQMYSYWTPRRASANAPDRWRRQCKVCKRRDESA